jgi:hypothetical protein
MPEISEGELIMLRAKAAEFDKLRAEHNRIVDMVTRAETDANAIVRKYLANGAAVFGVQPDHRFRDEPMLPMKLAGDIAEALAKAMRN